MRATIFFVFAFFQFLSFGQTTKVYGIVTDEQTGEPVPFAKVRFQDSKIGAETDFDGKYEIDTYYATDSLIFSSSEHLKVTVAVKKDEVQEINIALKSSIGIDFDEVVVTPNKEPKSTRIHKRVVANKKINNKEKLTAFEYELYNKMQLDMSNITEKFQESGVMKKLDVVKAYMDSTEDGENFIPMLLTENVSDFYFKKNPRKKKEVTTASRITGIENLELNQFLGDMYLDVNVYDNSIPIFNKNFVSPIAYNARSVYNFVLVDSLFMGNRWCYNLKFYPKLKGGPTLEGNILIHDTTYAVQSFEARISPWVDINFVQDLIIEQHFDMVEKEVWMLTEEKMFVELKLTKKTGVFGLFGRKHSIRRNFVINQPREDDFYKSSANVEFSDDAKERDNDYWEKVRPTELSTQEKAIDTMINEVKNLRFFKFIKGVTQVAVTGYLPVRKIEIGHAFSLFSFNQVEKFRFGMALRTSNKFSKRIELGGKLAYGFGDKRFKYGATFRAIVSQKKRGMLSLFYQKDIEQIGTAPSATTVGNTFNTLFATGPLDKLTFVEKTGVNLEQDVGKDFIITTGVEWKEYVPLGKANYIRTNPLTGFDTINRIQTSEITLRFRWTRKQEFIAGTFDRRPLNSRFPTLAIQGIFGVKGVFGSDYTYQKLDFIIEQKAKIGRAGRLFYFVNVGKTFGSVAYPFLRVHAGNQSFWLQKDAFNKMRFFEFISDQYVEATFEHHWDGMFFNRIPGIRKLKLRLVTSGRLAWGMLSQKNRREMIVPAFTKKFGDTPYVEAGLGIENILKIFRVDVLWRLTHTDPQYKIHDIRNFGVRVRYAINF